MTDQFGLIHDIFPTDISSTARRYAKFAPKRVLVWPTGGADSIQPYADAGIRVSVIGCVPIAHPQACEQVREAIRAWPFADQLERVLDCEEWASTRERILEKGSC